MDTEPSRSGHLPLNGLNLYHEVYGEPGGDATPLLLIPGAFLGTESRSAWTGAFAATRSVIVFDQQGHGRTPGTPRARSRTRISPTTPRHCCGRRAYNARM